MTVIACQITQEPILFFQFVPPSDLSVELEQMEQFIVRTAPLIDGDLYVIADCTDMEFSFNDVVVAEFEQNRSAYAIPFTAVLVSSVAQSTSQKHGVLPLFTTLDEALSYVLAQMPV
ncbi:MAG TPA: hypothetical protein VHP83_23885 [Aggregatilineaceae bacterium]|nr:hypothetical protein [Aggregatilineaceae bacterium]